MFLSLTRFLALLRSGLSYSGRCRRDARLTHLHALCLVHTTAPNQPQLPTREPTLLRVLLKMVLLLINLPIEHRYAGNIYVKNKRHSLSRAAI